MVSKIHIMQMLNMKALFNLYFVAKNKGERKEIEREKREKREVGVKRKGGGRERKRETEAGRKRAGRGGTFQFGEKEAILWKVTFPEDTC